MKSIDTRRCGPKPETVAKYAEAVSLYASTGLSCRRICLMCGVSESGFTAYLNRHRRDLLLVRYGHEADRQAAKEIRLWKRTGQTPQAHKKYIGAVQACDNEEYIGCNVSQIAREFNLDGPALANQLRAHYPEIPVRREKERRRLCINDNQQRGARQQSVAAYAAAIEMLRDAGCTIRRAAEACGVSYSGLKQHMLFYHRELAEMRRLYSRKAADGRPRSRKKTAGNARRESVSGKYAPAVSLVRDRGMSVAAAAAECGLNPESFRSYLHRNKPELALSSGMAVRADGVRVLRRSAEKYAEAIRIYETTAEDLKSIAARLGLTYNSLSSFIRRSSPMSAARHKEHLLSGHNGVENEV